MNKVYVDFSKETGAMKPLNGVNNGPLKWKADQTKSNFPAYKAARFPIARTHDAAFFSGYGGEHSVDITGIFPNFDADPYDPKSYDFVLTDEYLLRTIDAGTKILYRLGQKIEHNIKKYGTIPPKDFKKWAVICEHIIRHYNEGFADGHHLNIEYWEIWNEPDLDRDESTNKRCWGGTKAQFFDFYEIAAKHLKSCFPDLKIGGPAVAGYGPWAEDFLAEMHKRNVPLDFFSWHRYTNLVSKMTTRAVEVREALDRHGYDKTESILDEWNYVRNWGPDWIYSIEMMCGQKGAAFCASVISEYQYLPVDMATYYDARPGAMNGLFDYYTARPRPVYAPYFRFADLCDLGTSVKIRTESEGETLHAVAAKGEKSSAVMLTHYDENDEAPSSEVLLCLRNIPKDKYVRVDCYRLNTENEKIPFRTEYLTAKNADIYLHLGLFEIDYVTLTPVERVE